MNMNLSERHKFIINFLLDHEVSTIKIIAHKLGISERTVINDLNYLENVVKSMGLQLLRKPRVGISLVGNNEAKTKVELLTNINTQISLANSKDRQIYILNKLIYETEYLSSQVFLDELYISKGTLESDLIGLKKWLINKHIILKRKPNKGIKIEGDEKYIRSLLVELQDTEKYGLKRELNNKQDRDSKWENQFKFISEIDLSIIEDLVREAERNLGYKFIDATFQALVLHIAIAMKRVKTGKELDLPNEVLNELKAKKEFKIAAILVKELEEKFQVIFRPSECGYITLHLLSGKVHQSIFNLENNFDSKQNDSIDLGILGICNDMVTSVKEKLNIDFTKDNILINGLYIHLKAAINRLKNNMPINNPYLEEIKMNYTLAFEAAVRACGEIEKLYGIFINEDEMAYIAMHFGAALERNGYMSSSKNVIIICTTGIGTSQFVAAKVKRVFPELNIIDVLSAADVSNYTKLNKVDLIISTVPIENNYIPAIQVNPFLGKDDIENIKRFFVHFEEKQKQEIKSDSMLVSLLSKKNILILEAKEKEPIIGMLVKALEDAGAVSGNYLESVLKREKIASTAYDGFAIPHGDPDKVNKSCIVLGVLKAPIKWDNKLVNKVFLIAIGKDSVKEIEKVFDEFYDLVDDKVRMKSINSSKKVDEIYKILIKENT